MYQTEELAMWARSLRFFRFTHAIGGHANDGDTLSLLLAYADQADLIALLHALHILPIVFTAEPPRPEPNRPYSSAAMAAFPDCVPGTRWLRQPGHQLVGGVRLHLWCSLQRCSVTMISQRLGGYAVGPEDVRSALALEAQFQPLAERIIDPPVDSPRCLCPRYHPEIWANP